jgi:hypothetical protein
MSTLTKSWISHYGPEKYRIKPQPTYRPFTPEEALKQCRKAIQRHGEGKVWRNGALEYGRCRQEWTVTGITDAARSRRMTCLQTALDATEPPAASSSNPDAH